MMRKRIPSLADDLYGHLEYIRNNYGDKTKEAQVQIIATAMRRIHFDTEVAAKNRVICICFGVAVLMLALTAITRWWQ